MIEIKNLKKSFGENLILKGVNLSFSEGNIIGFVGSNGSGKTTLFNCISGLEKHEGTITYSGGKLKNDLGFLQTEPYILNKITGNEYLQLFCNSCLNIIKSILTSILLLGLLVGSLISLSFKYPSSNNIWWLGQSNKPFSGS